MAIILIKIPSFSSSRLGTITLNAPNARLTAMCPIGNSLNSRGYGKQKSHTLFNLGLSDEPEGEENP